VEDDVGFSLLQRGFDPVRVRELVEVSLCQVHLVGYEGRSPLEMSFGEKKRMCLAGCLIGEPSILYLDEPALGLDPRETGQLRTILKEIPPDYAPLQYGLSYNLRTGGPGCSS